jgi:N-acetylmuramic acid 6-phosphate etherase
MQFTKTTEQDSSYDHLEKMSVSELLSNINAEDKTVAFSVEKAMPPDFRTFLDSNKSIAVIL